MEEAGQRAGLAVEHISRSFGAHEAVRDVSFTVAPGELVALVGASGSGKTTTLRIVAGYEAPDRGRIVFDGADITRLAPSQRDMGMVFQHYALFPHMTVVDNVAFGLEARGMARAERRQRAQAALDSVGLAGKGERGIQQLSGGEQQRVALARAVVFQPRLLLLDEPLSNLDPALRQSTREDLRRALRAAGAPALFVTHDQDDAFAVADRVVLLSRGEVLQTGTPEDLYDHPASRDVAAFIGRSTLVPAWMDGDAAVVSLDGAPRAIAAYRASTEGGGSGTGRDAWAVVRPEVVTLVRANAAPSDGWPGVVATRRFAGGAFAYEVRVAADIVVEAIARTRFDVGDHVIVGLSAPVPVVER